MGTVPFPSHAAKATTCSGSSWARWTPWRLQVYFFCQGKPTQKGVGSSFVRLGTPFGVGFYWETQVETNQVGPHPVGGLVPGKARQPVVRASRRSAKPARLDRLSEQSASPFAF